MPSSGATGAAPSPISIASRNLRFWALARPQKGLVREHFKFKVPAPPASAAQCPSRWLLRTRAGHRHGASESAFEIIIAGCNHKSRLWDFIIMSPSIGLMALPRSLPPQVVARTSRMCPAVSSLFMHGSLRINAQLKRLQIASAVSCQRYKLHHRNRVTRLSHAHIRA